MARTAIFLIIIASQIYWGIRAYSAIQRRLRPAWSRWTVGLVLLLLYGAALWYNSGRLIGIPNFGPQPNPTRLGFEDAFLAVVQWWILGSVVAFVVAIPVAIIQGGLRIAARIARRLRRPRPVDPPRRQFLEHAATAVIGFPFVIGAYALLYGRLNLEITRNQIRLARLPRAFAGFRIAQLSDIHISAFMNEEQIRKFAAIANDLRADLMVLTGDFVTWDPSAEGVVVNALAGLKAPFGVFACLGNHEAWSGTKDSITLLLEQAGIRVLRDSRAPILAGGEGLNLIGIEPDHGWSSHRVPDGLVSPDRVNILLSHYPTVFDHAAEIGADLMLAGHTHGGQVKLNFISPRLPPALLHTPYVAGWFEKKNSQLYVNRGIGTIAVPMRVGVPPEITVFELV